jgi:hypothetical protein
MATKPPPGPPMTVRRMCMLRFWFVVVSILSFALDAAAEHSHYLCVVESGTGLQYDRLTDKWKSSPLEPGGKFIFRRLNDEDRKALDHLPYLQIDKLANWAFFGFETNEALATCSKVLDNVVCKPVTVSAQFDKQSLRFEIVNFGGFAEQGYWMSYWQKHGGPPTLS